MRRRSDQTSRRDPRPHRASRHLTGQGVCAVCFDLDGVLIDSMPRHAQAWQEAAKPMGLQVSRREIYLWEGESGFVTARTLLARSSSQPSPRDLRALLREKERRFSRLARRLKANPTLRRLLPRLRRRGVRLGLVTGTSLAEVRRVVPRRVLDAFDVIVTGDRVRRGKPHPDPYRTAFQRLGVTPHHTVVVENAPYGIRSARRAGAGLVVALTSSLPRRFLRGADVVASSPSALARFLERLVGGGGVDGFSPSRYNKAI